MLREYLLFGTFSGGLPYTATMICYHIPALLWSCGLLSTGCFLQLLWTLVCLGLGLERDASFCTIRYMTVYMVHANYRGYMRDYIWLQVVYCVLHGIGMNGGVGLLQLWR